MEDDFRAEEGERARGQDGEAGSGRSHHSSCNEVAITAVNAYNKINAYKINAIQGSFI
jgi:hypothetical protein